MKLPTNQIICGNCIEVMKEFPDESIDCVVTDPPYGISFMGRQWDKALPDKEAFKQMFRVLKPGALAFVMSSPRQDVLWRMMQMLEECGFQLKQSFLSYIYKTGFPKAYDVSKGIDKKLGRKQRILGINPNVKGRRTLNKGKFVGNEPLENAERVAYIAEPTSHEAKKWNGWKSITGLKPALECVLMVNKPFSERTIVDNVLKHDTGAINVDACRIPFQKDDLNNLASRTFIRTGDKFGGYADAGENDPALKSQKGRFPANLLVSDKALDTGKITKSGKLEPHHIITSDKTNKVYGKYGRVPAEDHPCYADVGDQSRYFDLDAWSKHHGFLDVAKASKSEREKGLNALPIRHAPIGNYEGRDLTNPRNIMRPGMQDRKARNVHPTVKPIKLMAYLIELGCPKNGVVLDPFVGSGTTCIAADQLNRKWIGIELNSEYVEIAQKRLESGPQKLDGFMCG